MKQRATNRTKTMYDGDRPRIGQMLAALILCTCSITGFANEFYAEAEVVSSEAIKQIDQRRLLAAECLGGKPRSGSLVQLLHWDLGTGHCERIEEHETITGYRVIYKWNDQLFSQVMTERPGERIPLRIEVD